MIREARDICESLVDGGNDLRVNIKEEAVRLLTGLQIGDFTIDTEDEVIIEQLEHAENDYLKDIGKLLSWSGMMAGGNQNILEILNDIVEALDEEEMGEE